MAAVLDFTAARYSRTCHCMEGATCPACRHFLRIADDVAARTRQRRAERRFERQHAAAARKAFR